MCPLLYLENALICFRRRLFLCLIYSLLRIREVEGASFARLALNPDLASKGLYDLLTDGQACARARVLFLCVEPLKYLEYALLKPLLDADAVVPHAEQVVVLSLLTANLNTRLRRPVELQPVAYEIRQELPHPNPLGSDLWKLTDEDLGPPLFHLKLEVGFNHLHQFVQFNYLQFHVFPADAAQDKKVFGESVHHLGCINDTSQVLLPTLVKLVLVIF